MNPSLVEIRSVSKAFSGVQALRDVSLELAAGEVHALCGENGAGKSTLIKCLAGAVRPDRGEIRIGGVPLRLGQIQASEQAGIAVIHQESTVFPDLSTVDNIFVGREPRLAGGLLLDRRAMRQATEQLMARLGQSFDIGVPVSELSVAQRQMVSMARALSRDCRLLIMDEPTASLSAREADVLFALVRGLREHGVCVLYVSHRLEEVFALADRVTVLRDGQLVETCAVAGLDRAGLIRRMVGRDVEVVGGGSGGRRLDEVRLAVRGLTRRGAFRDVSFELHAGEVLGWAGLVGAGRSEVAKAIFGVDRADAGEVRCHGRPLAPGSVRAAMEAGLVLVPEDRQHEGLVLPLPVRTNLSLAVLAGLTRHGLVDRRAEDDLVRRLMQQLTVKAASPEVAAETLSGGNQQKLVLGKWLAAHPQVLVLDEPTRGVDVGAKAEVHRLIRELVAGGLAAILISSELPEVMGLSDRILVFREGEVSGELRGAEATQEALLHLMLPEGGRQAAARAGRAAA